ncbi:hypothetical protein O7632_24975 [Solwaraspora sp. WMMD406]|uniref:hypothetical protein n=1 Tax=Solwaraspora sp. WMMD406 TaxID=3016095 RepID=UPI002415DC8D|nr:hypothetical protein [Solwaraspora sp. WMMD406]MDG4767319.1 hypothetical protein [Solwaraspora sp. WMMD406]
MQWDAEYEQVVAEYAAGRDVAELERQYGLSRAEIEWLVAYQAQQRLSGQPMSDEELNARRGTPPGWVVGAALVFAFGAVVGLAGVIVAAIQGLGGAAVVSGIYGALFGSVVLGLWQGRRGSLIVAIIFGIVSLPFGLIPILLLLVPASAREWFADSERTRARSAV